MVRYRDRLGAAVGSRRARAVAPAARLAAAGLVLDAWVRLYVADFKAGKDWDAAGQVAHRFMSGD
ncbi:hypothetical protein, partial [Amycolatopsis anabasis]|uniref:hypothetical protein n=1 Tax=Amycolatopsis anabasis TaxID=1840409 RepID=UPI001C551126